MNSRPPPCTQITQLKGFNLTGSPCDRSHFFPLLFHVSFAGQSLQRSGMLTIPQGLVQNLRSNPHGIARSS